MLELDEQEGGQRPHETEELVRELCEKVIPRLLEPMERDGREVKPVFCHGDFKMGNVGVVEEGGKRKDWWCLMLGGSGVTTNVSRPDVCVGRSDNSLGRG
jgi:hypothetical protein